jgi:hypothetical protein
MVSSHLYEDNVAFSYREISTAVLQSRNQEAARYNMKQSEMDFIEIPLFNSDQKGRLCRSLKFCDRGSSIEKFEGDMDYQFLVIGCQEYSHTIIMFRCTLYTPTRKPETVLPIPSPRWTFRGNLQRALKKFGEKRFPSLFRFSPSFGASGAFLRYEHQSPSL